MKTKLSVSAPPFSQWAFSQYPQQPQHQTQQLIMPKQEIDYSSSFISGHAIHHHLPQEQQHMQQQQQQQVDHLQEHSVQPPQIHLEESNGGLEDDLLSAEDLLGDPMLRPLGIEPMPPVDTHQHLISPYFSIVSTPLYGSSILGSPFSMSSLLNTPVATPGKPSANVQSVLEGLGDDHTEVSTLVIRPDQELNPNESYIQRVSYKISFIQCLD